MWHKQDVYKRQSLCLALSAFGSNDGGNSDYTNKYKNVEKLLNDLEFEEFDKNDWFVKDVYKRQK